MMKCENCGEEILSAEEEVKRHCKEKLMAIEKDLQEAFFGEKLERPYTWDELDEVMEALLKAPRRGEWLRRRVPPLPPTWTIKGFDTLLSGKDLQSGKPTVRVLHDHVAKSEVREALNGAYEDIDDPLEAVNQAVEDLKDVRGERDGAVRVAERAQREAGALSAKVEVFMKENEALRKERDRAKGNIQILNRRLKLSSIVVTRALNGMSSWGIMDCGLRPFDCVTRLADSINKRKDDKAGG